ncbi:MAG: hypothetical protein ABFC38_07000 [Methanospirillum sp.]
MRRILFFIELALIVLATGCCSPSASPSGSASAAAGHEQVRVVQTAVAAVSDPATVLTTDESEIRVKKVGPG